MLPKTKGAQSVEEFRPISLCNVSMKIITKVLANRLKVCLDEVISEFQSAFVKGRLISDNILVAHEVTHHLKHMRNRQDGFLSIKVDMSKAYDRVDWRFLKQMLLHVGFPETFALRIMHCVKSSTFKVKANGHMSEVMRPSRGIRQGDPLSPFLFLICQEWLSCSLARSHCARTLIGIQLARGIPAINHLFFANDCLIFITAELACLAELQRILKTYEFLAGQKINLNKSEISGSSNLDEGMVQLCGDFLNMKVVHAHSKYLGLPLVVGRIKERYSET